MVIRASSNTSEVVGRRFELVVFSEKTNMYPCFEENEMRDMLLALAGLEHNLLLAQEFAKETMELEESEPKRILLEKINSQVDALYVQYVSIRHTLRELVPNVMVDH